MIEESILFELPFGSNDSIHDPLVIVGLGSLFLFFDFYVGDEKMRQSVKFERVKSSKLRTEPLTGTSRDMRAFDKIVEVSKSDWATDAYEQLKSLHPRCAKPRHFIATLEGLGTIEVLAEHCSVGKEELGDWSEFRGQRWNT